MILARTFLPYTASASSADANYPAMNAQLYGAPFVPWRSGANGTDEWLRADLGSVLSVSGVFLDCVNVGNVTLEESANGTTWNSLGAFTLSTDSRDNRRRSYIPVTFSNRYLRAKFSATDLYAGFGAGGPSIGWGQPGSWPGTGVGQFQVGVFALCHPVRVLTEGPRRQRPVTIRTPQAILNALNGGFEVHDQGRRYLEVDITMLARRAVAAAVDEAYDWSAIQRGEFFVLAENAGRTEHAYLLQLVSDDRLTEHLGHLERGGLIAREVT